MSKKPVIENLTPEQEAMLPKYRDKWVEIGLSCEPCNFEEAKAAASDAYREAGLEPPEKWILVDSPAAAIREGSVLETMGELTDEDWNELDFESAYAQALEDLRKDLTEDPELKACLEVTGLSPGEALWWASQKCATAAAPEPPPEASLHAQGGHLWDMARQVASKVQSRAESSDSPAEAIYKDLASQIRGQNAQPSEQPLDALMHRARQTVSENLGVEAHKQVDAATPPAGSVVDDVRGAVESSPRPELQGDEKDPEE